MKLPARSALLAAALCACACATVADEIRLKGGKKLYGVIVAYEDDMFKVKTDDGYELVRKDKIESIIPSTPAGKPEAASAAKKDASQHPSKPAADPQPQAEPAVASSSDASATPTNASARAADPSTAGKSGKTTPKITNAAVKTEIPTSTAAANGATPAIQRSSAANT